VKPGERRHHNVDVQPISVRRQHGSRALPTKTPGFRICEVTGSVLLGDADAAILSASRLAVAAHPYMR
jgi:hypothetical protein